jgi:soluble lytic murein transglycosylase-like protein
MRLRWATITAALGGLAFVVPAQAQEEMAPEAAAASEMRPDGFRIAEGANGFQLVEHGIWRQPLAASSGAPVLKAGRTYLPYRYAKPEAGGPSGFRRASYLHHVYAAEAQYSLPSGLLDALVWTESRYNPLAISKAGAAGLGQLMPATLAFQIASIQWPTSSVRHGISARCSTSSG